MNKPDIKRLKELMACLSGDPARWGLREIELHKEFNALAWNFMPALLAAYETLQGIANANPTEWDEEVRDQFQEWAQSRARAAMGDKT